MKNPYSEDSDQQVILEGLLEGHPTACRIAEGWLRQTVRSPRFRVPVDEVDDLVQEALTQVLLRIERPGFEIRVSLKAFCRHIAMARTVDWIRRRRLMQELSPALASDHEDSLERIARKEELNRVHAALSQLKSLCRDLIRWHFLEEKSYQTIATETQRNASTLRVHMFNCLKSLRQLLQM